MEIKRIDLTKFRGAKSSLYTGRPQGKEAREELKLDSFDKRNDIKVIFEIPEGTTSFNPSFYLGLLYDSYKQLDLEGFSNKYSFDIKSTDPDSIRVINSNLEDGKRNAFNELHKKTGLWAFIKNKK